MIWYSHLFKNFPQFVVIHTVKGFGIVNKAKSSLISYSRFFHIFSKTDSRISGSVEPFGQSNWSSQAHLFCKVQWPSVPIGSSWVDSTNGRSKILRKKKYLEKNCRKFQKAKLEFAMHWQLFTSHLHRIYNYLHSIYILLGIISNLEMI